MKAIIAITLLFLVTISCQSKKEYPLTAHPNTLVPAGSSARDPAFQSRKPLGDQIWQHLHFAITATCPQNLYL